MVLLFPPTPQKEKNPNVDVILLNFSYNSFDEINQSLETEDIMSNSFGLILSLLYLHTYIHIIATHVHVFIIELYTKDLYLQFIDPVEYWA